MAGKPWKGLDRRTGSADLPDEKSPDTSNTAPYNGRVDLLGPRPGKTAVTPQGYAGGIAGIIPFQLPGATHILVPQFDGTIEDSDISGDGAASFWPTGLVGDAGAVPGSYTATITFPSTTATISMPLGSTYSVDGTRLFGLMYKVTIDTTGVALAAQTTSVLIEPGVVAGGTTYLAGTTLAQLRTNEATEFHNGNLAAVISNDAAFGAGGFFGGGSDSASAARLRLTVTWAASADATCFVSAEATTFV